MNLPSHTNSRSADRTQNTHYGMFWVTVCWMSGRVTLDHSAFHAGSSEESFTVKISVHDTALLRAAVGGNPSVRAMPIHRQTNKNDSNIKHSE